MSNPGLRQYMNTLIIALKTVRVSVDDPNIITKIDTLVETLTAEMNKFEQVIMDAVVELSVIEKLVEADEAKKQPT